ncbi:hypothetical protein [Streptomyces akebiae]|uniref:Uncharacterized protein n=1 Tax=Streptomyces akebiae TaxID=2865673 RepID=A0ABX8XI79_9ACTN|nr:hypothetical protein [Streptomyces akebiae]QYX75566.1 hypothetical protein K1J60_02680 [Streptomyces akebiae]
MNMIITGGAAHATGRFAYADPVRRPGRPAPPDYGELRTITNSAFPQ